MTHQVGYVDAQYLQAAARLFAPIKQRSYDLMRIQSGQRILDVGCGPGIDTVHLAQIVGPEGRIIGIDQDHNMLTEADRRAQQSGVDAFVTHQPGDATSLSFDSEHFNACRSERLFLHLQQPERALAEMARVTKPNGRIVLVDTDAATVSFDTCETAIERKLLHYRAEKLLNNGYSGRRLYGLLKRCGLADVKTDVFPLFTNDYTIARYLAGLDETEKKALEENVITSDELNRWHQDLEKSAQSEVFFASASVVLVAGRKPL